MSLCVCIQLLKIIKFANTLVPKMSLATSVLSKALSDLVFFGVTFGISLFSFSVMFYVQLGPVMEGYNDQISSFISLARALFGDFDIDDIINNSSGYLNAILFITYLFVAVFIMLSMFFAILGEAQAGVRADQDDEKTKDDGTVEPEYGVFFYMGQYIKALVQKVPWLRQNVGAKEFIEAVEDVLEGDGDKKEQITMETLMNDDATLQDEIEKIVRQLGQLGTRVDEMTRKQKRAAKGAKGGEGGSPARKDSAVGSPGGAPPERASVGGDDMAAEIEAMVPRLTPAIVSQMGPRLTREIVSQIANRKSRSPQRFADGAPRHPSAGRSKPRPQRFDGREGTGTEDSHGGHAPARAAPPAEPLRPTATRAGESRGLEEETLAAQGDKLLERCVRAPHSRAPLLHRPLHHPHPRPRTRSSHRPPTWPLPPAGEAPTGPRAKTTWSVDGRVFERR
jgi:hypothetical protein